VVSAARRWFELTPGEGSHRDEVDVGFSHQPGILGRGPVRLTAADTGVTADHRGLPAQDDQDAAWRLKNRVMLIALLAVLGVDLIVIVVLVGVLLSRRAWVSRQPGAFKGAIRVADGEVPGLRRKWKRGFGRWVGDVLVWTVAPFLFRNELIEADRTTNEIRQAGPDDKVRRVGSSPVIMVVAAVSPQHAWQQPILRLADTVVGVAVGALAAWTGIRVRRLLSARSVPLDPAKVKVDLPE